MVLNFVLRILKVIVIGHFILRSALHGCHNNYGWVMMGPTHERYMMDLLFYTEWLAADLIKRLEF